MGVSVRHNLRLAAVVALAAAVMTVAWFARALQTGALFDWFWCVVVATVGVVQLLVVRDGRAPLMVADDQGVRVRRGETWSGLRWQDIEHVEVQSPASWLRDGQIVVHPVEGGDAEVTEAYVVPLSRTTKLEFDGLTGDLVGDLDALASGRVPVLVLTRFEPEAPEKAEKAEKAGRSLWGPRPEKAERPEQEQVVTDDVAPAEESVAVDEPTVLEEPVLVELLDLEEPDQADHPDQPDQPDDSGAPVERLARVKAVRSRWARVLARLGVTEPDRTRLDGDVDGDVDRDRDRDGSESTGLLIPEQPTPQRSGTETDEQVEPEFEPVDPQRAPQPAARSEVLRDSVRMLPSPPAIPAQRTSDTPVVVARVDEFVHSEPRPAPDALIGPLIAAARHRARLSIDTLSERTRIRPHVLESIEVDDFEACGGDFYARGHLRTLARVFGLDAQQLLDLYDDHYAKAEIEARQVFEAELASGIGGGVRAAYRGPRWSLLAACVVALVAVWGVARVFNDTPQELVSPAPNVVDSAGLANAGTNQAPQMTLAPLEVTAVGASPQVVVRDRDGRILWAGKLAEGQHTQVIGLAPFDVTASNGASVKVSFLGKPKGTVGGSSAAGSKQFG